MLAVFNEEGVGSAQDADPPDIESGLALVGHGKSLLQRKDRPSPFLAFDFFVDLAADLVDDSPSDWARGWLRDFATVRVDRSLDQPSASHQRIFRPSIFGQAVLSAALCLGKLSIPSPSSVIYWISSFWQPAERSADTWLANDGSRPIKSKGALAVGRPLSSFATWGYSGEFFSLKAG